YEKGVGKRRPLIVHTRLPCDPHTGRRSDCASQVEVLVRASRRDRQQRTHGVDSCNLGHCSTSAPTRKTSLTPSDRAGVRFRQIFKASKWRTICNTPFFPQCC